MNHDYADIRSRIAEEPKWWDENAVPRYSEFGPLETADIYAAECALLLIECQSCRREFRVAMSVSTADLVRRGEKSFPPKPWLTTEWLEYGDPPNVECCPAGPTMNSVPIRVLEFWSRHDPIKEWERRHELEVKCDPEWMREEKPA